MSWRNAETWRGHLIQWKTRRSMLQSRAWPVPGQRYLTPAHTISLSEQPKYWERCRNPKEKKGSTWPLESWERFWALWRCNNWISLKILYARIFSSLRAMADATMRYIERREFVYEEEQRRIAEAENEDVNEGVESMELPRKKSSKALHREFVGSLKLDRPIARGISLRKSLWARPWTFPKVDRKAKRLWHSAKRVELFDIFISHVWKTSWSLKFTSLILQSCWIFMLTAWVFVATLVFLLCFLGLLPLGWRYEAEALDTVVECKLGPWIVGFSMPACLLLGQNSSLPILHNTQNHML